MPKGRPPTTPDPKCASSEVFPDSGKGSSIFQVAQAKPVDSFLSHPTSNLRTMAAASHSSAATTWSIVGPPTALPAPLAPLQFTVSTAAQLDSDSAVLCFRHLRQHSVTRALLCRASSPAISPSPLLSFSGPAVPHTHQRHS